MPLDADAIKRHFAEEHYVDVDEIDLDTPLFTSGLVNSFAMADVMFFIEEAVGRKLNPMDFTVDRLNSINAILAYVREMEA